MSRSRLLAPAIAALTAVLLVASAAPASARTVDSDTLPPLEAAASGPITGRVLIELPAGGSPVAANEGRVSLYSANSFSTSPVATGILTGSGTFSIASVPAGQYLVEVVSTDTRALPVREWFNDQAGRFNADPITVLDSTAFPLGDIVLESRSIATERLAGSDRFATAAAISERYAIDGAVRDIVIVNGLNFPDALSAGPLATSEGAVVLMVTATSIPAPTRAELNRLSPRSITIIGGTSVVSSSVAAQLDAYIDGPGAVTRIAGSNRYETSRRVVNAFDTEPTRLFVATGQGFPDALAAVPAAGVVGGAVLLVDGSRSGLDSATRSFINALDVPVTVVGGTSVVSQGVFDDIDALGVNVERIAGSNRFATSVGLAITYFPIADYAYIANGFGFADALAIGSFAGTYGSPLYLATDTCVPQAIADDIIDGLFNGITGIGGRAVLADSVLDLTICQ